MSSRQNKILIDAVKNGSTNEVVDLVTSDPRLVSIVDKKYRTPLHLACKWNFLDVARVLIAAQADINARNCWGHTPLHTLCHLGNVDGCTILLRAGASMSVLDNLNYTPLDFALHHNHPDVGMLLVESGAPVNCKGPSAGVGSPLHWACKKAHTDLIRLLVEKGASESARNFWRRRPIDVCASGAARDALQTALAKRERQQAEGDCSFGDIYGRGRDDSTTQGIDRDEQEDVRISYQLAAREQTNKLGGGGGGVHDFLKTHCSVLLPENRISDISKRARDANILTVEAFAKTLESESAASKRKALYLSDYELASIMRVLEEKNLLRHSESNDFLVNGLKVHNLEPLQVASCVTGGANKKYATGMFTGQLVTTDARGDLSCRQICLKSNIGTVRDIEAEVKLFKEVSDASGLVAMISHGKVHHGSYFVMEWFGSNLSEFLSSSSFVSVEERIQIFTELLGAVCSLHSRNIMHGDICPDNILIDVGEFGLSLMLCDLSNARRVGELYPHHPGNGSMIYTPGYCAPEVYFGSAKQCRASTKIDVFCLGLVGGMLLSRQSATTSANGILPIENGANGDTNSLKKALREQEVMNSLLVANLEENSCKDVLLGMCSLTPALRGDVETVVNILQTRNSTVERNTNTDFSDLFSLLDKFASQLEVALGALRTDFIFRSDLQESLKGLSKELQRSHEWVGGGQKLTGDPKECLRIIQGHSIKVVNAYAKKLPESEAAEVSMGFIDCVTSISTTVDFSDGHEANSVADDKLFRVREIVTELVTFVTNASIHMTRLGEAIQEVAKTDGLLSRKIEIMKSDAAHMTSNQREQVAEINMAIARLEQSMHAVEGINMGLVHFMRGQLNTHYDKLNDVLRRTHYTPHLFLLLPKVVYVGDSAEEEKRLVLVADEFKLFFLCSHTFQIIPSQTNGQGYDITIPASVMDKIAPLALVSLLLVREALLRSSEVLSAIELPEFLTDTAHHVQFLDFSIQTLLNPPEEADERLTQQEIDSSIFENITLDESSLDVIKNSALSIEIAYIGYDTLRKVLESEKCRLTDPSSSAMRQVLCQGKIGWVLDVDAAEAGFIGLGF